MALALHVGSSLPTTRMLHPELPYSPGEVASPSQDQGPHPTTEIMFLSSSTLFKESTASPTGGCPQERWDFGRDQLNHLWLSLWSTGTRIILL